MTWLWNGYLCCCCSRVNSYTGLVVVMMKVHRKKDTVDMVDMMLVEVMVEVHTEEVLVINTHIVVDFSGHGGYSGYDIDEETYKKRGGRIYNERCKDSYSG
eukprot:117569_1